MISRLSRPARLAAFTLVELMIVVVIIGVLAMVAVPAFRRYIYRARATEGTAFLQEIRGREETYKVDNGRYAEAGVNPSSVPVATVETWDTSIAEWNQLGAAPDNMSVRFQYSVTAGLPGAPPDDLGYDGEDFWYVARATADLDGDGTTFFLEGYSFASHVYSSDPNGFD